MMKSPTEAPNEELNWMALDSMDPFALAADPTTPPEILDILSMETDPRIGFNIALNPNAREELLHQLWVQHPSAILENPIVSYRVLSTGDRFHELLPKDVKLALYRFLRSTGRDEDLETYLPASERRQWFTSYWKRHQPVAIPRRLLQKIQRWLATDSSLTVREAMVENLPPTILPLFANDPDQGIRLTLAQQIPDHDSITHDPQPDWSPVIDTLCADPSQEVRETMAGLSRLTPFAHGLLARDPSVEVRCSLARKGRGEGLLEADWLILAAGSEDLSQLVAANGGCPWSVRLELTKHPSSEVRVIAWENFDFKHDPASDELSRRLETVFSTPLLEPERVAVAGNQTITEPVMARLMRCGVVVLRALAANPKVIDEHRIELLRHPDENTALTAVWNASTSKPLDLAAAHANPRLRAAVAGMVGARASVLRRKLAADPSLAVREAVYRYLTFGICYHRGVNISGALDTLSRDPIAKMRAKLVREYRLPRSVIERMATDPSVRVRLEVLKHSKVPVGHLGLLDHKSPRVRLWAAKILLKRRFAEGATISLDVYCKIAKDSSPAVRVLAAETEELPVDLLWSLVKDKSLDVQQALVNRNFAKTLSGARDWRYRFKPNSLREFETHRNPIHRAAAASITTAGKRRLQRMISDRCWFVRAVLAKNARGLEYSQIKMLTEDRHPVVRACARKHTDHDV